MWLWPCCLQWLFSNHGCRLAQLAAVVVAALGSEAGSSCRRALDSPVWASAISMTKLCREQLWHNLCYVSCQMCSQNESSSSQRHSGHWGDGLDYWPGAGSFPWIISLWHQLRLCLVILRDSLNKLVERGEWVMFGLIFFFLFNNPNRRLFQVFSCCLSHA